MSEIFLTSDTHFCHNQSFIYEPRGFSSVKEMNEAIVERWNNVVKPDDMVFHLGDLMLNDDDVGFHMLKRLNGHICVVWGNHDSRKRQERVWNYPIITLGYAHQFEHKKITCYLSHYPTLTANYDVKHFNQHVINFHAHTHQKTNFLNPMNPFMYHVGMDSHNCTPVNIEEAISDIRNRWNEIGQLPVSMKLEDTYPYMR